MLFIFSTMKITLIKRIIKAPNINRKEVNKPSEAACNKIMFKMFVSMTQTS